jgi:hypothetical protein
LEITTGSRQSNLKEATIIRREMIIKDVNLDAVERAQFA